MATFFAGHILFSDVSLLHWMHQGVMLSEWIQLKGKSFNVLESMVCGVRFGCLVARFGWSFGFFVIGVILKRLSGPHSFYRCQCTMLSSAFPGSRGLLRCYGFP